MTHAAKGQHDTNGLEVHRIKMLSQTVTCFEGIRSSWRLGLRGVRVEEEPSLHPCSLRGDAGVEPGWAVHPDDRAAGGRGVSRGTGERHHRAEAATRQVCR